MMKRTKAQERRDIARMCDAVKDRANYSLALLGMGAVRHGSGQFLNIRPSRP